MAGLTRTQWEYLSLLVKANVELEQALTIGIESHLYKSNNLQEELYEIRDKIADLDPYGIFSAQITAPKTDTNGDIFANLFLLRDREPSILINLQKDNDRVLEKIPNDIENHESKICKLVFKYASLMQKYIIEIGSLPVLMRLTPARIELQNILCAYVPDITLITDQRTIHYQLTNRCDLMSSLSAEDCKNAITALEKNNEQNGRVTKEEFAQNLLDEQLKNQDNKITAKKLRAFQKAKKELLEAQYNPEYQFIGGPVSLMNGYDEIHPLNWSTLKKNAETKLREASKNFIEARIALENNLQINTSTFKSLKAEYRQLHRKHIAKAIPTYFRIVFDGLSEQLAKEAEEAIFSPEKADIPQFRDNHLSQAQRLYDEKQRTLQEAYFHQLWIYEFACADLKDKAFLKVNLPYIFTPDDYVHELTLGTQSKNLEIMDAHNKAEVEKRKLLHIVALAENLEKSNDQNITRSPLQLPDPDTTIDQIVNKGINLELEFETKRELTPAQRIKKNQHWNILIQYSEIKFGPGILLSRFQQTLQNSPKLSPSKAAAAWYAFKFLLGLTLIGFAIGIAATSFGAGTPLSAILIHSAIMFLDCAIGGWNIKKSYKQAFAIYPNFKHAYQSNRRNDILQKFVKEDNSELKPSLPAMRAVK